MRVYSLRCVALALLNTLINGSAFSYPLPADCESASEICANDGFPSPGEELFPVIPLHDEMVLSSIYDALLACRTLYGLKEDAPLESAISADEYYFSRMIRQRLLV